MEFFEKLSSTFSAAGKEGLSKAREVKDAAKYTVSIKEREGTILKLYRELGKAYYQIHKNDPEPEFDEILAIKAAFEEIGELKSNMDELRGIKRCPNCGSPISPNAKFCQHCGGKCEEEVVECEVVEDEPEDDEEEVIAEDTVDEVVVDEAAADEEA